MFKGSDSNQHSAKKTKLAKATTMEITAKVFFYICNQNFLKLYNIVYFFTSVQLGLH